MGCAPMAFLLWSQVMKYNPANPRWVRARPVYAPLPSVQVRCNRADPPAAARLQVGRDRFVLSNGHACALQYVMLHLTGYDVSMDDLKAFRQMGSKCGPAACPVPCLRLFSLHWFVCVCGAACTRQDAGPP